MDVAHTMNLNQVEAFQESKGVLQVCKLGQNDMDGGGFEIVTLDTTKGHVCVPFESLKNGHMDDFEMAHIPGCLEENERFKCEIQQSCGMFRFWCQCKTCQLHCQGLEGKRMECSWRGSCHPCQSCHAKWWKLTKKHCMCCHWRTCDVMMHKTTLQHSSSCVVMEQNTNKDSSSFFFKTLCLRNVLHRSHHAALFAIMFWSFGVQLHEVPTKSASFGRHKLWREFRKHVWTLLETWQIQDLTLFWIDAHAWGGMCSPSNSLHGEGCVCEHVHNMCGRTDRSPPASSHVIVLNRGCTHRSAFVPGNVSCVLFWEKRFVSLNVSTNPSSCLAIGSKHKYIQITLEIPIEVNGAVFIYYIDRP